jgi:hypothetical protein
MKHLLYFKENNSFNKDIAFEDNDWLIIKPSSYESLCYWGQNTNWTVADGSHEYYFHKNKSFVIINKSEIQLDLFDKKLAIKYYFNFYNGDFLDNEDNQIDLRNFLDKDIHLYEFFGDQINVENILEIGNEWWFVVPDWSYFADYFKVDRNTREDLIKKILEGETWDIFSYDSSNFDIGECDFKIDEDDLLTIKIILLFEQQYNEDYDYDITEIKNYSDVVDIVKEYSIAELKKILQGTIREGHEQADGSAAWTDIINHIYSFFNFDKDSTKWAKFKGNKYEHLWLRFKDEDKVRYSKYLLTNYNNDWNDDLIEYSPPYYGYDGKYKEIEEVFNSVLSDRLTEYETDKFSWNDVKPFDNLWKKIKQENSKATEEEILDEVKLRIEAKKYNL